MTTAIEVDLTVKVTKAVLQRILQTGIVLIEPTYVIIKCGKKTVKMKYDGADFEYAAGRKRLYVGVKPCETTSGKGTGS